LQNKFAKTDQLSMVFGGDNWYSFAYWLWVKKIWYGSRTTCMVSTETVASLQDSLSYWNCIHTTNITSNSTVQNLHSLTDFTGSGTYTGTSVYILYQCWLCLRFHHNMPIAHAELHRFPGMLPYNLQIMEKNWFSAFTDRLSYISYPWYL